MIKEWFKTYLIGIISALLFVSVLLNIALGISNKLKQNEINKLNVELGVVAGISQNQEVKVIESKVIEEKIHVVTAEKLKIVKEYIYDENKSDCENGIAIMRRVF